VASCVRHPAAEQITYTKALRRVDQRAEAGSSQPTRTRITKPVATLMTDVILIGHTGPVYFVAFHPDGRSLVSGGDVTARLWDLATRQNTMVLSGEAEVTAAALHPDGSTLAMVNSDPTISLWALGDGGLSQPT